jgi:hypothetical protein
MKPKLSFQTLLKSLKCWSNVRILVLLIYSPTTVSNPQNWVYMWYDFWIPILFNTLPHAGLLLQIELIFYKEIYIYIWTAV